MLKLLFECRFFTPTIHAMKETSNLYILVLSNGGYDGLGKIREKEMEKAAKYMGFKGCDVVDDKEIPDGPWKWELDGVVRNIKEHIEKKAKEGI